MFSPFVSDEIIHDHGIPFITIILAYYYITKRSVRLNYRKKSEKRKKKKKLKRKKRMGRAAAFIGESRVFDPTVSLSLSLAARDASTFSLGCSAEKKCESPCLSVVRGSPKRPWEDFAKKSWEDPSRVSDFPSRLFSQ